MPDCAARCGNGVLGWRHRIEKIAGNENEFRLMGFAFSRELGSILAGGLAPFICTALFAMYRSWVPIVAYMCVLGVITLIALAMGPETLHRDLEE